MQAFNCGAALLNLPQEVVVKITERLPLADRVRLASCCKAMLAQSEQLLNLERCSLDLDVQRTEPRECARWLAVQPRRLREVGVWGWQFVAVERATDKPYSGPWSNDGSQQLAALEALAAQAPLTALSCQIAIPSVQAMINLGDYACLSNLRQLTILAPSTRAQGCPSLQYLPTSFSQLAALTKLVLCHTGLGFGACCLSPRLATLHCCQAAAPPQGPEPGPPREETPVCFAMVAAAARHISGCLQELALVDNCARAGATLEDSGLWGALNGNRALSRLTGLTSLVAHGLFLTRAAPPELAALTRLRHLALENVRPLYAGDEGEEEEEADHLLALTRLSHLRLAGEVLGGRLPPALWLMPTLKVVDLHAAFFETDAVHAMPRIPAGATQLERLQLQLDVAASNARAIRTMRGLELLGIGDVEDAVFMSSHETIRRNLRRVLRAVGRLPRLRHLRLGRRCAAALQNTAAELGVLPTRVRVELSVSEAVWPLAKDGAATDTFEVAL